MGIAFGAGQLVNHGLPVAVGSAPPFAAGDLAVATANVTGWGGQPALFAHFLAAALATAPLEAQLARRLAAVAGWRSGVLGLRREALAVLPELPAEVAGAVLGFPPDSVAEFCQLQQVDPYWWPGRPGFGQVLRAGGFTGLGGPWLSPPVRAGCSEVPGRWVVLAGDRWWQLDADVFGSRLLDLDDTPWCGAESDAAGVRIGVRPDSYLVRLDVPAELPGRRR